MQNPPKNHWYCLGKKTLFKKNKISCTYFFGKPILLYRDASGQLHAMEDRCPHRQAPLSKGRIVEGKLECPYHGWQFSPKGHCVNAPGLYPDSSKVRAKLKTFLVTEKDGLSWIMEPSSKEDWKAPEVPNFSLEGYKSFANTKPIQGHTIDIIENFLDPMHTHYVHAGLIRRTKSRKLIDIELIRSGQYVEAKYLNEETDRGLISMILGMGAGKITGVGRFYNPSIVELAYFTSKGYQLLITLFFTPSSDGMHHATMLIRYKAPLPLWIAKPLISLLFYPAEMQDKGILGLQWENRAKFPEVSTEIYTRNDFMKPHITDIWSKWAMNDHKSVEKKETFKIFI